MFVVVHVDLARADPGPATSDPGHTGRVIDPTVKRSLGQMIKGVQVVAATHDGTTRAYTSHWVSQVAFEEPIVMASVSPKHDTSPLIAASGRFTVSVLAADQITEGQYFSYPGRRFRYVAPEYLTESSTATPWCRTPSSWFTCDVFERTTMADHELFFGRITASGTRAPRPSRRCCTPPATGGESPGARPASPASRSATSCWPASTRPAAD